MGCIMQLPDESIDYQFQGLLAPPSEAWSPLQELQNAHFLTTERVDATRAWVMQVRGQVAAEREVKDAPAKMQPLQAGFIDLPQQLLDAHRRKGDASDLGRILLQASRLREQADRVIVLGTGGALLAARALFDALCHTHHNEMQSRMRIGRPRMYFVGNDFDNDALQDLFEMLEAECVDPELREERWGVIVVNGGGDSLETNVAFRLFRNEAARYYGSHSEWLKKLFLIVASPESKLRDLCRADGYADEEVLSLPSNVGGRYSAFSAVGLLPAAVMGLDVRALLLGASAMTRRFLEEPFERNPVLQYAAINYLMTEEKKKTTRVMTVWSRKLETLGWWYDQLISESLGKMGRGPTPLTMVGTRDFYARGQQLQDGDRTKLIHNLYVRSCRHPGIPIGMADRNEDDLNGLSRKTLPDLLDAALTGVTQAYFEAARPTADLLLPVLTEHTVGQLMQMLMLATVIEGRMMGVNPYSHPGAEVYRRHMMNILRST